MRPQLLLGQGADSGEIVATSESYTTKAGAKNGIESVQNTPGATDDDPT